MDNKKVDKVDKILFVSLSEYQIPVFKENKNGNFISYGVDNKYPNYLLDLYNKSPKHGAIIRSKANYVVGKGFEGRAVVNRYGETANALLHKQALDLEIHSGFYVQIIWDKGGKKCELFHLDYHKVRSNKDNTTFFVKEDWASSVEKAKEYPAFNPERTKGTQILYFKSYRPGLNTYTLPDYISGLNYIEADKLVSEHVLNNAKTGFTPSKMIVFTDGEPETEEEKRELEKSILKKYTGTKGNKLIIAFAKNKDVKPDVLDLGASDLTKEDFEQVDNLIQSNIFSSHQITTPALFGISTPGQLGESKQMRDGYEIFKNTYVNNKQQQIESVWEVLFPLTGNEAKTIIPVEPVGYTLEEMKAAGAPKSFLLEKMGIDPKLAEEEVEEEPEENEEQEEKFSDQDILSMFSEVGDAKENYLIVKSRRASFFSEAEFLRGELDAELSKFKELSQAESDILGVIEKDKRATPEVIAKALGLDVELVNRIINNLLESGALKSKTEKVGDDKQVVWTIPETSKVERKELTKNVFVRYSYEGPKDERNRDFCAKMMEMDKVYSRAEIEQISQRLGYSVWERRGGFYHNPRTDRTTPYCRHHWSQHIVIKKK